MCKIILPIKPKYAFAILRGEKTIEYRKIIPKKEIDKIVIYATAPIKKVVGEVVVTNIIKATPEKLWNETSDFGYISKKDFKEYFLNHNNAYGIEISKVSKYEKYKDLSEFGINFYPQSFVYLD